MGDQATATVKVCTDPLATGALNEDIAKTACTDVCASITKVLAAASQALSHAALPSDNSGSVWYGQVKTRSGRPDRRRPRPAGLPRRPYAVTSR